MLTIQNFERLKVFHVVYLNKSILKASHILSVTRSAVSQSLKGLEEELKVPLFIRDSKNFQPTAEAEQLFLVINPFVNELHSTLQQIESGIKSPAGHLRIGAPLDFGSTNLTRLIGQFRKKYPLITFELVLAVPIKQLDLLCAGKLDLAFIDNGDIHSEKYPVSIQKNNE
ncbi:MAG: LysR family transcriptional regulator [Bdellovibrionota bacterium]